MSLSITWSSVPGHPSGIHTLILFQEFVIYLKHPRIDLKCMRRKVLLNRFLCTDNYLGFSWLSLSLIFKKVVERRISSPFNVTAWVRGSWWTRLSNVTYVYCHLQSWFNLFLGDLHTRDEDSFNLQTEDRHWRLWLLIYPVSLFVSSFNRRIHLFSLLFVRSSNYYQMQSVQKLPRRHSEKE